MCRNTWCSGSRQGLVLRAKTSTVDAGRSIYQLCSVTGLTTVTLESVARIQSFPKCGLKFVERRRRRHAEPPVPCGVARVSRVTSFQAGVSLKHLSRCWAKFRAWPTRLTWQRNTNLKTSPTHTKPRDVTGSRRPSQSTSLHPHSQTLLLQVNWWKCWGFLHLDSTEVLSCSKGHHGNRNIKVFVVSQVCENTPRSDFL